MLLENRRNPRALLWDQTGTMAGSWRGFVILPSSSQSLLCNTTSTLIVGHSPKVVPTLFVSLNLQAIGGLLLIWMVGQIISLLLLFYYEVKDYKSKASKFAWQGDLKVL